MVWYDETVLRARVARLLAAVVVALGAASCGDPAPEPGALLLTPTEHLARASLALRGVRPEPSELAIVAADPAALPALVDRYLDSPELGAMVRELHNEVFRFKLQHWNYLLPGHPPLDGLSATEVYSSIYDEPLRLIEDVIVHDRPYTQIVTAGYTMADPIVAAAYGLPHSGQPRWERTVWLDARGAAGILTTNAPYLRYRSTFYNFNRGRANAFSRGLLCHDFLEGEIHLDTRIDIADPEVVRNALVANPSCVGCHQTLDPLASYFFAFRQGPLNILGYPLPMYYPEATEAWRNTNGRAPAYFGRPIEGLTGLGQAIAEDPRFARCMVRNFASYLLETPAEELPHEYLAELHRELLRGGLRAKALLRAIVLSPRFALAGHEEPPAAEPLRGILTLRPQALARMVEALTGYRWASISTTPYFGREVGPVDYLDDDLEGYRVLAGGIDSYFVTQPSHTMNATRRLVVQRLALDAARAVVEREALAGPRRLFAPGSLTDTSTPSVRRQLARLRARIYSELVSSSDPALDEELELFHAALEHSGDPLRAWTLIVAAMLGDLRAVTY